MPSTYAHYKFGTYVYQQLPKRIQEDIKPSYSLYEIGQHGPDILFYYHPLWSNYVNRTGFGMHEKPARPFFMKSIPFIHDSERLSYIIGFICHYVLDSYCHEFIGDYITYSGISHTEIEAELDRLLLSKDGFNPISHRLTDQIDPSFHHSYIIQTFFPSLSVREVQDALRGMIWYNNLILVPNPCKRRFVYGLLRITGNYKEMQGLVINRKPNPKCVDSNTELMKRLKDCVPLAVELIQEYLDVRQHGSQLSDKFMYTYSGKKVECD